MQLISQSFQDGQAIPGEFAFAVPDAASHVALSSNRNPHLAWSGAPAGTQSFVVVCHDPDVPSRGDDVNQEGREVPASLPRVDFFHWLLLDIPAATTEIAAGAQSDGVTPRGKSGPAAPGGLRHLGGIAYDTGDIGAAERAYKQVVSKAKYSEFRDPEDHVNLVKTLVKKGDAPQASGVLRDMERSLRGSANVEACRAISAAMLHELSGNDIAAAAELHLAAAALDTARGLSTQLKVGLVQSCLKNNLEQAASEVMMKLVNEADSDVTMEAAVDVFEKAGRHDLAQGMGQQITHQVQELMQEAASKSESGELKGAVFVLRQALRKTPGNLPVLFASVDAILRQLNMLGWEAQLAEQAQHQMQVIRKIDPRHPQLESLKQQYEATQHKYGIAT